MQALRHIALLAAAACLAACGADGTAAGPLTSEPVDTSNPDAGTIDAAPTDSGGTTDTSKPDTNTADTLSPDTGTPDTSTPDTSTADTADTAQNQDTSDDAGADAQPPQCTGAKDCPASPNVCLVATCDTGKCGFANQTDGEACDDGNACTSPDTCGGGACLPGAATACDDGNSCTLDKCDASKGCSSLNVSVPCDDGSKCTLADQCKAGACVAGGTPNCDDSNPCTDDACEGVLGCVHTANTAPCSDDNACTTDDGCNGKVCLPGQATTCDDNNPCTTDACEAKSGCVQAHNQLPCDDGDACTLKDACAQGSCISGDLRTCDDNNACTTDACNKDSGCTATNNTSACDDGDLCTADDTCKDGKCAASGATACDDGNPCTTDGCDKTTGCSFKLSSGTCDDGNKCTDFDICSGGKCKGVLKDPKADCDDNNACTTDGCDKATGCTNSNNELACDDGNSCSKGDTCKDGKCSAGANVCDCTQDSHCAPSNPKNACLGTLYCDKTAAPYTCKLNPSTVVKCSAAGDTSCAQNLCDETTLKCAITPVGDGKSCDADGSVCTVGDACIGGTCTPGKALTCDDKNVCTNDACDPKLGCVNTANSAPCDADGNPCTVGDVCVAKACTTGKQRNCDDGDECTDDSCDAQTGNCVLANIAGCGGNCRTDEHCDDSTTCTTQKCEKKAGAEWGKCFYTNQPGKCTDFNGCTDNDHCDAGKCVGTEKSCVDGNLCTNDGCDPTSGCVFAPNSAACDDFDLCTLGDQCKVAADGKAKCAAGTPKKCDDGDKCTADSCNPATGACSAKGIPGCGGYCQVVGDCDDKNVCTSATCDKGKCVSTAVGGSCDDGNLCTLNDKCGAGKCASGSAKNCDDKNPCSVDACDSKTGACINTLLKEGVACDDGDKCSSGDKCSTAGGNLVCEGSKKDCNDANVCTDDVCDAVTGNCQPKANTKLCEDGNKCTVGDACKDAKCVSGTGVNVDTLSGSGAIHGNTGGFADGAGDKSLFTYVYGVAVNAQQVVYAADPQNHRIRKILQDGTTSTLAGAGKVGLLDGKGGGAWFNQPYGVDVGPGGDVYVADTHNHSIRKIAPDGTTTTIAGNGNPGHVNGTALLARFNTPYSLEVTAGGTVFVADTANHRIRKISAGIVSTIAGTGVRGSTNGPGAQATFDYPADVAVDPQGNVLVTDQYRHRIRSIDPKGNVTTFSGTGVTGNLDGSVDKATWHYPWGIDVDSAGVIYVANRYSMRIRRIENGVVTTHAGSGTAGLLDGKAGSARFYYPAGLAVDVGGGVYVADGHNHRVRRVRDSTAPCAIGGNCYADGAFNPSNSCQRCNAGAATTQWTADADGKPCTDGDVCTSKDGCTGGVCKGSATACDDSDKCTLDACDKGTGQCVFTPIIGCGGNCTKASDCDDKNACTTDSCITAKCDNAPNSLACDDGNPCTAGDVCTGGKCAPGAVTVVSTLAGNGQGKHVDGKGAAASLYHPRGVELDAKGNLYIADGNNNRIRMMAPDGTVTTIAGAGTAGFADGKAADAMFHTPSDVAMGPGGTVYVADVSTQRIRILDPAKKTVTTLAGGAGGYKDGKGDQAQFNAPYSVATNGKFVAFVPDYNNHRLRKIETDGTVTTLAGNAAGFANGKGTAGRFRHPLGVAVDRHGDIFVADYGNHAIRKVTKDGVVSTLAGTGQAGNVNGSAASARFQYPWGITVDASDRVFVMDRHNHALKMITGGVVTRVAGVSYGFADGNGMTTAHFYFPMGITAGPDGSLYIGDHYNHRIRKVVVSRFACSIGGACYTDGLADPANSCQACDGAKTPTKWTPLADGVACTDGDLCTGPDSCSAGSCAKKPISCDDSDKCTKDYCDDTGVCRNDPIIGCGGYCTEDAHCKDGNACTDDACTTNKCTNPNNVLACDDGNDCTLGDICGGGACTAGKSVWVDTIAGNGKTTVADGDALDASFGAPIGLGLDGKGGIYFSDRTNHLIKKLAAGVVTTIAGTGKAGFGDGPAKAAQFYDPADVDVAASGAVWVADRANHRIRLVLGDKVITLAGSAAGSANGKGTGAQFYNPYGLAVAGDAAYVADYSNHRIRKVKADGTVTTFAGGAAGYANGKGTAARFNGPIAVDVGPDGTVWVVEHIGARVRRITSDGTVTLVAGSTSNQRAYVNGEGANARFNYPWGIAVAPNGHVLVADGHNHRVREIVGTFVSHFAGSGSAAFGDGAGGKAHFYYPRGLAIDAAGVVYVGDQGTNRVRRIRDGREPCRIGGACYPNGTPSASKPCLVCDASKSPAAWTPLADAVACEDGKACTASDACQKGECVGSTADCDDGDKCTADSCAAGLGTCEHSKIVGCNGFCTEDKHCDDGNPCTLGDVCVNSACGKATQVITTTAAGGAGGPGFLDGAVDKALFNRMYDVAVGGDGKTYVADYNNNRVRLINNGQVTTFAGSGQAGLKSGKGTDAWLNRPAGLAVDATGTVWLADRYSYTIRKITADGTVSTFAGNGQAGATNGKGTAASFREPIGIAVGKGGTLYVADYANHRMRRVLADGTVQAFAGSSYGYKDGPGATAQFRGPIGVGTDGHGNVYISELSNHMIRRVTADGIVTTLAGSGQAGVLDGDAATAKFYNPWGMAVDSAGRVFVGSYGYHRIRMIENGVVTTVTGGAAGYVDGAAGQFRNPLGIAVDAYGQVWVADYGNNVIRVVRRTANSCSIGGACWTDGSRNPSVSCKACSGATNAKDWTAAADGVACADGALCTVSDTCTGGTCKGGARNCDDKDPATADSCEAATGRCVYQ